MKATTKYRLEMNSEQVHELNRAVELMMRLKLGQYRELPYTLINLEDSDYADRRDDAEPHLASAFKAMRLDNKKDRGWYILYNIHQVVRYAIRNEEAPDSTGVDSYPPIGFGYPLPEMEVIRS